jgi:MFS transporter, YNFM family, putative membrane transport protein
MMASGKLRILAIGIAGFCTFMNLYSPQALLPMLAHDFGVSAVAISSTVAAAALAVALTAPFSGAAADVLGRKVVIVAAMVALSVPTLLVAFAPDVPTMVLWRFVQGMMLPPIFVVAIAYVGDEWPRGEVAAAAGVYTTGASLGGTASRLITGSLADLIGWRGAYVALAFLTLALALAVAVMLPRETRFVRSESLVVSLGYMKRHLRNPQLVATYAVGFGTLFNFIATFTYVTFLLAAPPYGFSATLLGMIFLVYLGGAALTPLTGRALARWGRRRFMLGDLAVWVIGILLTLLPSLFAIIAGLLLCACAGLLAQAVSTGYVAVTAQEGRSSAVGLYVTSFYVGGGFGALLPGLAWTVAGWPACVAMVVAMLGIMATVVYRAWTPSATAAAAS